MKRRFPDGIPLLDPIQDMGIEDEAFKKLVEVSLTVACTASASPVGETDRPPTARPASRGQALVRPQKMSTLEERLAKNALAQDPRLDALYDAYNRKSQLSNEAKALKKAIRQATAITQMDELKCRKRVLRRYASPSVGAAARPG